MYANGQSHPSFNALTVMMNLTSQLSLMRSIFLISSISAVLIFTCSSGMPPSMSFAFNFSKVTLSSEVFGCAWKRTIGRMYLTFFSICCLFAFSSRLRWSIMAFVITSVVDLWLYTITGSLTIFSSFNCIASTKLMILLFVFGVAVKLKMKLGLISFFNSIRKSDDSKLWLSSITITGLSWAITWSKEVSSAFASILLLYVYEETCSARFSFSRLALRPSLLFEAKDWTLRTKIVKFSLSCEGRIFSPTNADSLFITCTLLPKSTSRVWRYGWLGLFRFL